MRSHPGRSLVFAVLLAVFGQSALAEAQTPRRAARAKKAKSSRKSAHRPRPHTLRPRVRRAPRSQAAKARRRGRAAYEPHLHGSAVLWGKRLIRLAQRHGDLEAGLRALGLAHLPRKRAIRAALKEMNLYRPGHGEAYGALRKFRAAAFARGGYDQWVRATVDTVRSRARTSYVQLSSDEAGRFLRAARRQGLSLDGFRVLVSVTRGGLEDRARLAELLARPEVAGLDIVGPEKRRQSIEAFHGALDLLLAPGARRRVFRIHAGEGYLGEGGEDNVNLVLRELTRRAEKEDLGRLKIVLAHGARIADLGAASRALRRLRTRGVEVEVNVNPLSNIVYRAVERLDQIDALKLEGARIIPGSDNVGTLRRNAEIVQRLRRGDLAAAEEQARPYLRLRDRQPAHP